MINIAFVIDSIVTPSAGTEKQLLLLLNNLDRSFFKPYLVCLHDSEWLKTQSFSFDVVKYKIHSMASLNFITGINQFKKFCKENKIDIVQTFFLDGNKFGIWGAHKAGIPVTIASRRNIGHGYGSFTMRCLQYLRKWTDYYFANSQAAADMTIKMEKVRKDKTKVIYNILELDKYKNIPRQVRTDQRIKWNVTDDEIILGITANLRDVKNVDSLIRVLSKFRNDFPKLKVISVGEGPDRPKLQNLIDELGLTDRFILDGRHSDIIPCLAGFDIAALCSTFESFSNSLIEYMAVGLPIVCSNVGGNNEAITHKQNGLIYNVSDEQELENSLRRLLNDSEYAEKLGNNAQKSAFERYSKETIINQHQDYYESLLNKSGLRK